MVKMDKQKSKRDRIKLINKGMVWGGDGGDVRGCGLEWVGGRWC